MLDPVKLLARIRQLGANLMLDGEKLIVVNRSKLPPEAIEHIRQSGNGLARLLDQEAEFEERAAIIEYDGGLTRQGAEFLARILLSSVPKGASPEDWSWFVSQASTIVERNLSDRRAA